MRPGDFIKICFLPVGATFIHDEYGIGELISPTHSEGETPGRRSNGWYGYPDFKYRIVWLSSVLGPQSLSLKVIIESLPSSHHNYPYYPTNVEELEPEEKESAMERNIAALMREDAKTVSVVFINKMQGEDTGKQYTYVTHLDFEPGDIAIVDSPTGLAVVKIICVHEDLAIEPGQNLKMKWIVDKVDMESHLKNVEKNDEIEKFMATSYRANVRNSFKTMMLAQLDPDSAAKLGSIIGDTPPAIEDKPKGRVKK